MPANTTKASLRGPVLAFSTLIAIAGLLLLATAVHAEKTTWTTRETITRREANVYLTCRWDPLEGIPIRLSRPDGSRAAEGIVGRRRTHFIWTVGRPENDRGLNDRIRTHTVPLPDSPQDVELTLRRRARGWSLYLDAYLAAELPEIDPGDIVIEHAATALPSAEALDVLVQKVAPFTFADAFMVPEDAEQKLGAWEIIAGNWGLHTAAENLELHGRYKKNRRSQRPEADRSPNFYSLGGAGTNAMMVTGYDFYDRYTVRAAVKAADGECGLAFLVSIDGACHAFTLRRNPDTGRLDALLWRSPTGTIDDRKLLGAARTELLPDQWYRLEVEIHDRRLVARIDHIDVIDVTLPLPAGGRFGLFADHPVGTRFDDVEAWSHHDLAPADDGELTDITLSRPHGFSTKRGQLPGLPAGPRWQRQTRHLLARPRKERAVWHVGAPTDPPGAIAMRFDPEEEATFGLVAGHTAPDTWGAVFTCKTSGDQRVYRLERQTPGGTALLDTVTNRVPDADAPLDLRLDMTEPDAVRAYADNRLVLLCPSNTLSGGAVGWVVDAGSKVRMSLPVVETRPLRFRNRFEKNRNFVDDPFMRHWSSPEGQWVTLADKRTWYKGDFFGRYALHLPYKPKTTLHLGVPEQSEVGVLRISNTNDAVHVSWHGNPAATNGVMLGSIPAAELRMHSIDAKTSLKWLSIEQQDNLLWIHSKGRTLLRTHLPAIPTGRRIRAEGYGMDDLKFSRVDRYRVLDCLFTESPFRWTLHGGRWEIVNRFQCQPRWSHMNGENAEGLAALWSKYAIEGDFCVEFYAGERHEWYERAGDLNLTVLNESNSPADGYTVACTTWDPDFSQEQTHLYRNGAKVADSDKYLVPRVRDGQKRKGYNPLVTAGRDMHGAWYYMKLRRAGSNVSYHFDNEPVFTYDDPDPLASGAMGIWTYRNSMVVARVTIAAEKIAPRRFKFAPLALDRVPRRTTPVDETAHTPPANLTLNGRPLTPLAPERWMADDSVSRPIVQWTSPAADAEPEMQVSATQAAGSLHVQPRLPPAHLDSLAGWSFDVRRTAEAGFNALFSLGAMGDGEFKASRQYFHKLSGTDDERGPRALSGATPVPAAGKGQPLAEAPWTPVTVWIPMDPRYQDVLVHFDGFGNLQPGSFQKGLDGNRGAAQFAIRNFREIHREAPQIVATNLPAAAGPALDALRSSVARSTPGLIRREPVAVPGLPRNAEIWWVDTPTNPVWAVQWSQNVPDALTVTSPLPWPDPRLASMRVRVDGKICQLRKQDNHTTLALLPRTSVHSTNLTVTAETTRPPLLSQQWSVDHAARMTNPPPVLLRVEGPIKLLQTFETRPFAPPAASSSPRYTAVFDDARQGTCLQVMNSGKASRLVCPLGRGVDLVDFPLLQLRYRAEGLARVSVNLDTRGYARFSEPFSSARPVRGATGVTLDNQWHTWTGTISDALATTSLRKSGPFVVSTLSLRSADKIDRTGHHSSMMIDDIVLGGAIGPATPLKLTPHYADVDGIRRIEAAVFPGNTPYDELIPSNRLQLAWQEVPLDKPFAPDLAAIPDGIVHVALRAADNRWAVSQVTDLAFLLDRKPIKVSHAVKEIDAFAYGSVLELQFATHGGSLMQFEGLKMTHDGATIKPRSHPTGVRLTPTSIVTQLDWTWMLREALNKTKDGDTVSLTVSNIKDGAGNPSSDLSIPFKVDYAADKRAPAVVPTLINSNIWWTTDWQRGTPWRTMRTVRSCRQALKFSDAGEPYMELQPYSSHAAMASERFPKSWDIDRYPFLALRIAAADELPTDGSGGVFLSFQVTRVKNGKTERDHERLPLGPFGPKTKSKIKALPDVVHGFTSWNKGQWNDIIVDVSAYLKSRKGSEIKAVHSVGISFYSTSKKKYHLGGMWILGSWKPEAVATIDGYDASGIAGITLPDGTESDDMTFLPARYAPPNGAAGWCSATLRDRAGNLSYPIKVPIPPITPTNETTE